MSKRRSDSEAERDRAAAEDERRTERGIGLGKEGHGGVLLPEEHSDDRDDGPDAPDGSAGVTGSPGR